MIHQFTHKWEDNIRFWVDEKQGRKELLGRSGDDSGQELDYQKFRLGIRSIGRSTDVRTLIVGPLPRNIFCGNSLLVSMMGDFRDDTVVFIQAILNSFVVDSYIRQMVSANINMFYIYQIPVPRLVDKDKDFIQIVTRAARLICTTPEFDALAKEVGLKDHKDGVTDLVERVKIRAELDALVAQLYGLTEEEFAYILTTFPIVPENVKTITLETFKSLLAKKV